MKTTKFFSGLLGVVLLATQASAGEATKLADLDGQAHAGRPAATPIEQLPAGDLPAARDGGCGKPGTGSCCESNGTPDCECAECCEIVCAVDPFCCDTAWDSICAGEASDLCTDTDCACGDGPRVGACCDHATPDGACQDNMLESDCLGGGGVSKVYEDSGIGLGIPDCDLGGISSVINVPDRGAIVDLDIDLTIAHTWVGDLCVTVTDPSGQSVRIIDQPGLADPGCGGDCCGCSMDNYAGIILDDEGAGGPIETQCLDGLASPPNYTPNNPLSAFDGKEKQGDWTITVIDNACADVGMLDGWSLHFTNQEASDQAEWFEDMTCADVEEQGLCEEHTGACCDPKGTGCIDDVPESQCPADDPRVTWYKGLACDELDSPCRPGTVSITDKGSLLIFSKVEIKWDAAGNVTQDTFLDMTNDYPKDVFVQLYFVNGDEPADPVFAGDPPVLIERGHPGWNWVDCQVRLTNDQPMYWSALTGGPLGCQMFTVLDPGTPPGRPDLDGAPGSRVLRGFVYAWAVDQFGEEICWNYLKGDAVIVNYADPSAWEYNAYAARTFDECEVGDAPDDEPGHICLNGAEYAACYDKLLLDFYASGSTALSGGGATVQVDTDLTLFPVDADLRQDTCGPVVTKAKFDIWNMNEIRFSGTTRCITCWDQTLLSNYDPPNHFLLGNLHTDKGKARIDGIASQVCDANDCDHCEWPKHPSCSQDAPLLGVVKKELAFSGGATGRAAAGMTLVGMGEESTCIQYDIIEPPEELQGQVDNGIAPVEAASQARIKVRK